MTDKVREELNTKTKRNTNTVRRSGWIIAYPDELVAVGIKGKLNGSDYYFFRQLSGSKSIDFNVDFGLGDN